MANTQINLYKKAIRHANNAKKRQALFISEYIQVKYNHLYQEAAELYNAINVIHPKKPDLRKSAEFKNWKLVETGRPKIRPHVPRDPALKYTYDCISINEEENQTIVDSVPKKTLLLRIPLMDTQHIQQITHDQVNTEVIDEGESIDQQTVAERESIDQQTVAEGESTHQQTVAERESIDQQTVAEGESIDQQTVAEGESTHQQTVTHQESIDQQTVAEGESIDNIQPSFLDSLNDQTVNEIMQQLREDEDLCGIMDDMDMLYQSELLDIGMEIEVQDRLEEELERIM